MVKGVVRQSRIGSSVASVLPATLQGSGGITIERSGNITTIGFDSSAIDFNFDSLLAGEISADSLTITASNVGNHQGENIAPFTIVSTPVGANGTVDGLGTDHGEEIQLVKKHYGVRSETVAGNLRGVAVVVRNTGPDDVANTGQPRNDADGVDINCYNQGKCGFIAGIEMVVGNINDAGDTTLKEIDVQIGAVNSTTNSEYAHGVVINGDIGTLDDAVLIQADTGAGCAWANGLRMRAPPTGNFIELEGQFIVSGDIGANNPLKIFNESGYSSISFNNAAFPASIGISGDSSGNDGTLYCYSQTEVQLVAGSTAVARVNSSGNFTTSTIATTGPRVTTNTTESVAAADDSVVFNAGGTVTLTLPVAATFPGRWIHVKTIAAQLLNSASSNVKPIGADTAGTAILAATVGKWAALQSDGTDWVIMMAN